MICDMRGDYCHADMLLIFAAASHDDFRHMPPRRRCFSSSPPSMLLDAARYGAADIRAMSLRRYLLNIFAAALIERRCRFRRDFISIFSLFTG